MLKLAASFSSNLVRRPLVGGGGAVATLGQEVQIRAFHQQQQYNDDRNIDPRPQREGGGNNYNRHNSSNNNYRRQYHSGGQNSNDDRSTNNGRQHHNQQHPRQQQNYHRSTHFQSRRDNNNNNYYQRHEQEQGTGGQEGQNISNYGHNTANRGGGRYQHHRQQHDRNDSQADRPQRHGHHDQQRQHQETQEDSVANAENVNNMKKQDQLHSAENRHTSENSEKNAQTTGRSDDDKQWGGGRGNNLNNHSNQYNSHHHHRQQGSNNNHHNNSNAAALKGTTSQPFVHKQIKDRSPIGGADTIAVMPLPLSSSSASSSQASPRGRIPNHNHCLAVLVDIDTVTAEDFIQNVLPAIAKKCAPLTAEFAGNTTRSLRLSFPTPAINVPLEITSPLTSAVSMDEEAEAIRSNPSNATTIVSPTGTYYYNNLLRQAGGSAYFPSIFGGSSGGGNSTPQTPFDDSQKKSIPATIPRKHIASVVSSRGGERGVTNASSAGTVVLLRVYGHGMLPANWRRVLEALGGKVRERSLEALIRMRQQQQQQQHKHKAEASATVGGGSDAGQVTGNNPTEVAGAGDGKKESELTFSADFLSNIQLGHRSLAAANKPAAQSVVASTSNSTASALPLFSASAAIEYFQVDDFLPTAMQMTAEIGHLLHHSSTNLVSGIVTCVAPSDRAAFLFEAMRHQRHFVCQYVVTNGGRLEGTSFGPVFVEDDDE